MFMLYYEASTKKVHAVNGSGPAPAALTLERCLADLADAKSKPARTGTDTACAGGPTTKTLDIPPHHPHSVTVPGAAAGWCDAVSEFGSGAVTLSQLMEPAALLAEEGFPVSPITAHHWGLCAYQLETGPNKGVCISCFVPLTCVFLRGGGGGVVSCSWRWFGSPKAHRRALGWRTDSMPIVAALTDTNTCIREVSNSTPHRLLATVVVLLYRLAGSLCHRGGGRGCMSHLSRNRVQ